MSYSSNRVRGAHSGGSRRFSTLGSVQQKRRARGGKFALLFSIALGMGILFGLMLMVMIGHGGSTATASGGGPGVPGGYGSLNHPKGPCGNAGQSSCAAPNPGWFAIGSDTPAAAAAAMNGSKDFLGIAAQYGCPVLHTPALVYSYGARTGIDYYDDDHWVVSVHDSPACAAASQILSMTAPICACASLLSACLPRRTLIRARSSLTSHLRSPWHSCKDNANSLRSQELF